MFPEGHAKARLGPVLLVLTFAGGLVDAVSFLDLGKVFVANMTGNVAFLGLALAGVSELSAPASGTALGRVPVGAAVAGRWGGSGWRWWCGCRRGWWRCRWGGCGWTAGGTRCWCRWPSGWDCQNGVVHSSRAGPGDHGGDQDAGRAGPPTGAGAAARRRVLSVVRALPRRAVAGGLPAPVGRPALGTGRSAGAAGGVAAWETAAPRRTRRSAGAAGGMTARQSRSGGPVVPEPVEDQQGDHRVPEGRDGPSGSGRPRGPPASGASGRGITPLRRLCRVVYQNSGIIAAQTTMQYGQSAPME
ncbi:YoaK family protein [Kitasatospora albolonga]|uniref:YoaK family protein n=1 Tax=Kitasatospora albolonga TaxID=68173 RepID=UPI0031EDDDAC